MFQAEMDVSEALQAEALEVEKYEDGKNRAYTRMFHQDFSLKIKYSDLIIYICIFHVKEINVRRQ